MYLMKKNSGCKGAQTHFEPTYLTFLHVFTLYLSQTISPFSSIYRYLQFFLAFCQKRLGFERRARRGFTPREDSAGSLRWSFGLERRPMRAQAGSLIVFLSICVDVCMYLMVFDCISMIFYAVVVHLDYITCFDPASSSWSVWCLSGTKHAFY